MRLLFVCKSLPLTYKGGIQTHVWELTRELIARGCEVSILTAGSWRAGLVEREQEGRTIIELPYLPGRRAPLLRKTFEDVSFNVSAYAWLKLHATAYDRVHIQGRSGCFFAARRAARHMGVVTTFHRLLDVEYAYDGQRTGWLDGLCHRAIMGRAERRAARNSEHVVAVSEEMERELREATGKRLAPLSIIPNGVNPAFGSPVADRQRYELIYVGRLERIKGVHTLLAALPHVDERVQLVVVGEGPERASLERQVRRLELRTRVRFLGNQDAEAVRYWVQRAYALALPSYHETQGVVLLEAAICRRPVLAASVPGIDEVVEHGVNGLMFPAGDAESLAFVMEHLFSRPRLAERLGEAGYARAAEYYDWAKIAQRTLTLYRGVGVAGAGEHRVPRAGVGASLPEQAPQPTATSHTIATPPPIATPHTTATPPPIATPVASRKPTPSAAANATAP